MAEYKYEDELSVLRRQNSALRTVNRSLRRQLKQLHDHSDLIFEALCDEPPIELEAELTIP